MEPARGDVAMLVLAAAGAAVAGIQDNLQRSGFRDVRPAHGFAFVRIAQGDATALDVAEHLAISKQAAGKLVDQLVDRGYVVRTHDPSDRRRRPLQLTQRGRACTGAAEAAAQQVVNSWQDRLGADGVVALRNLLQQLDLSGPIRPAW
ncbi:MAG: MarR family winged helix-turn-helix transcriptional regulator [Nakamurella sp.]